MNSQKSFSNAIIGKALTFSLALCFAGSAALSTNTAYAQIVSASVDAQDSSSSYTADDLDNLLAPIALYPDPLLAQVLVAATFDDQIQDASQVLSAGSANVSIDDQPWDDSVKAVAHYPKVLFTLAAQPDWTSAIGQAYVAQSTDVMNSIQRLRSMALAQGNLSSTQQQLVAVSDGAIQILPARAGFMFLPAYDPALAFSTSALISFGPALAVDASADDHIDWHAHHIFDRHHRDVRTGYRGSRGSIRNVRGPVQGGFNPGVRRPQAASGPVNRGRYNPGFARGPVNRGQYNSGSTYTPVNRGQANAASAPAPGNRGQYNSGSTYAPANRGQANAASAPAPGNRGQYNPKSTYTPVNRGQANAAPAPVNRAPSSPNVNRGQVSRAPVTTAMNRGFAPARSLGRTARR